MANERTPLITTVLVGPPCRRYHNQTLRRFCTIALSSSLVALLITFLVTTVYAPDYSRSHRWPHHTAKRNALTFEQLQAILLETPSAEKASQWSHYYTSGAHLAGQNLSQAEWTRDRWEEWGVESDIVAYDTYLNYPLDHRLALLRKGEARGDQDSENYKIIFEASLTEDILEEDPTTQLENSIPTFHGYSASGNVTGSFVYVNYGTFADFEDLVHANVSLKGKIAVARYGGIFRGLKVKRAEELGMIGCVIYGDPGDDGDITEENGLKPYPDGPARNPSSVQRGSVQYLSIGPGDPTTPGYPSKPGVVREPVDGFIPGIPSLPISYSDALPILRALNGHGPRASDINEYWTRNAGLGYKGVEYNVGPSPDDLVLNLVNQQDYTITPMWDVIGIINGTIPDEVIIIGNHRDAWIVGGAGDPNSGSAVLNEVVRSFGQALEQGWKPLRTIVFASWDGEEYGLVGSTEWVEEYLPWISASNVAYINVDVGVRSANFEASAAPMLHGLLYEVTGLVQSPNQTIPGQTIRDVWDGTIHTMGSGSDFTAFQDYAGVPSLDMGFGGSTSRDPVYHYHSNYDSYYWMSQFGDPGFLYHQAMAQLLGLTIARIADVPVLALNATAYAVALSEYVEQVESKLTNFGAKPSSEAEIFQSRAKSTQMAAKGDRTAFGEALARLYRSIGEMNSAATKLDAKAAELAEQASKHIPWWHWLKKLKLFHEIRFINNRYKKIERAFLYGAGLDGRSWFKHVVFAPGLWTGYAGGMLDFIVSPSQCVLFANTLLAVFPGLVESIDNNDFTNAMKWVDIIDNCIKTATKTME
ncbi:Zn-dependent exopeptidase [Xylaria sp. CBS 124048]|nr:Zn-dependent exopeptidase [Xylaria sp. CBS 124048]